jgi:hypothetical protein
LRNVATTARDNTVEYAVEQLHLTHSIGTEFAQEQPEGLKMRTHQRNFACFVLSDANAAECFVDVHGRIEFFCEDEPPDQCDRLIRCAHQLFVMHNKAQRIARPSERTNYARKLEGVLSKDRTVSEP